MALSGSKISNAPANDSFVVSFVHLELGREHKEDSWQKQKASTTGQLRLCALLRMVFQEPGKENYFWYFKGVLT